MEHAQVSYKLIAFPLPADLSLVTVSQKENSKPAAIVARLRSMTAAMTVRDGDEETTTTAKGNSGHNVPLNATQYAEAKRIIDGLRAGSAEKASAEAKATAAAIVAELREYGGIRLPVNRQGRHAATGESIGDLFAGLTTEPTE